MYFMGKEVKNAPVPDGYALFFVEGIEPVGGDILPWQPANTIEDAAPIAANTLKDPDNAVFWNKSVMIHKKINNTSLSKPDGGKGTFFLGIKLE